MVLTAAAGIALIYGTISKRTEAIRKSMEKRPCAAGFYQAYRMGRRLLGRLVLDRSSAGL
jgi:hypothetical protein